MYVHINPFSPKHNITEDRKTEYERTMHLTVNHWTKEDEAHYSCFSTNSLGKADGRIQTYSESHDLNDRLIGTT